MSILHSTRRRLFWTLLAMTSALAIKFSAQAEENPPQEMISLPVQVLNDVGQPMSGVKLIPWALRSSQGHGGWHEETLGKLPEFTTDSEGRADVVYPRYVRPEEFVKTTEVTLSVNHPDFVYISHEDVAVPVKEKGAYTMSLERGGIVEIAPIQDDAPAKLDGLYTIWSDARSWQTDFLPQPTPAGRLQIPPMAAGHGEVLIARIKNGKATHFSPLQALELKVGETQQIELELRPAVSIRGVLSDNVPRPIKNGRVVLRTLADDHSLSSVIWGTWATLNEDGTFTIEGWPADESIQLIALCDGYIAQSGAVPSVVGTPPRVPDFFNRPQVFAPDAFGEPLIVQMDPMVECTVSVVVEEENPLSGVVVGSYPNVGWWNDGSQIYCGRLFRSAECMAERNYLAGENSDYPRPFMAMTDDRGIAKLFLPTGKESLFVDHKQYELPIIRGRRTVEIEVVDGEPMVENLELQPKGREFLGEWDKLAGVLFGCTGEECRRLLDDPGFRERITAVRLQLDEAEDVTDPQLLKNAFAEISAAFDEVGDDEEVDRWRRKAAEQEAKLKAD